MEQKVTTFFLNDYAGKLNKKSLGGKSRAPKTICAIMGSARTILTHDFSF